MTETLPKQHPYLGFDDHMLQAMDPHLSDLARWKIMERNQAIKKLAEAELDRDEPDHNWSRVMEKSREILESPEDLLRALNSWKGGEPAWIGAVAEERELPSGVPHIAV